MHHIVNKSSYFCGFFYMNEPLALLIVNIDVHQHVNFFDEAPYVKGN